MSFENCAESQRLSAHHCGEAAKKIEIWLASVRNATRHSRSTKHIMLKITSAENFILQVSITEDEIADIAQPSSQQLLASLNAVYADSPTDEEREQLRQLSASQRRLVEGEW